jgi:cyd operon protein YbgT
MWYFAWMLGVGFAVLLAVMNAMWGENEAARAQARLERDNEVRP